jgi:hypothetical protein
MKRMTGFAAGGLAVAASAKVPSHGLRRPWRLNWGATSATSGKHYTTRRFNSSHPHKFLDN